MTSPHPRSSAEHTADPRPHLAARARDALAALADEFGPLLQDELARMAAARDAWRAGAPRELHVAAHDLKGLGATFGAPLAGRIAASLERLLADDRPSDLLVEAHVDAIRAVVRESAADGRDPLGEALAAALEAAVAGEGEARLAQAA